MSIAGCTVATRTYLADARLVARSWLDHHPGSSFTILVVDPETGPAPTWTQRAVSVVGPDDVGLDRSELLTMAAMYSPAEIACALKPWALRHVLDGAHVAVYLDGDVEVLSPMDEIEDRGRQHGVVLFPHALTPMPRDGCLPGEDTLLAAGMYNGGVMAVGRSGQEFLRWWAERLRRDCLFQPQRGFLADQRWLDFVPVLFDHHIERDPTYDVAYWNLHERPTSWVDGALHVFDRPVRCFHYSGLVDDVPWRLTSFTHGRARADLASLPAVARQCRGWIDRRRAAGVAEDRALGYRYARTAGGVPLDQRSRTLWRDALLAAEADPTGATPRPPSPFADDGGAAWVTWLCDPVDDLAVSRYLVQVWSESPPLQWRFPALGGADRRPFLRWAGDHAGREAGVPGALRPDPEEVAVSDAAPSPSRPPRPDARAQQPLTELAAARAVHEAPAGGPGGAIGRALEWALAGRDRRAAETASALIAAIGEMADRVATLADRVDRARDAVYDTEVRTDALDHRVSSVDHETRHQAAELTTRLADLEAELASARDRLGGALEEDRITGTILADAERRLDAEVRELRQAVGKLADDTDTNDTDTNDADADDTDMNDTDTNVADSDPGTDARGRLADPPADAGGER